MAGKMLNIYLKYYYANSTCLCVFVNSGKMTAD